jgi:Protein of unknown function (DUF3987)
MCDWLENSVGQRMTTARELLGQHGIEYVSTKTGKFTTSCPNCSGGYCNVKVDKDRVAWYCHGCEQGGSEKYEQRDKSDLGDPAAIYDYDNEKGERLFQALRFEPVNGPKQFRQRTGPDQEKWSIKGVRIVPFKLPELIADLAAERVVFVVEGEKDVLTLREHDVPATCNPMGAGKWWASFNEIMKGGDIIICGDNDQPGRDHVALVAKNLHGHAARIRILDLKQFWPQIEESDDVTDWFDAGGTAEQLWQMVEQLPDWQPTGNGKAHENGKAEARQEPPHAATVFDPWERFIVPAFPFNVLPKVAQDFVVSQSAVIGCDASGLAMATLAAFSGALDHRFALKMMRNGSWYERPRLWVLLVADASLRKTPTMNAVTRPLVHYETHLRVKYEADLRDFEQAEFAVKQSGDAQTKLREPKPPLRFLVYDTTVEKLGELLERSPKGLLVKSDEISGWLGSMERYANAGSRSDRAFWLVAYDGGPYTVDRVRRGEIHVKNLSVSVLGSIQPQRLAEMQGLTSDGLLQRFLPVMMGSASFPQDRPSEDDDYNKLVRALIFAKPASLIMTDAARTVMDDLRRRLFDLEQASGGLASGFQSFVGKLHGLCGGLALILHMAHDPETGATVPVDETTVASVRRLVLDFIVPHAHEFYCGADTTDGERLRRLASWILTSGKERVLASDLATNVRDFRGLTLVEVNERVSPLVAGGWLQPIDMTPVCRSWTVAPQVHVQLAERAKLEETRKAALADLMGSPRKSDSGLSGFSTEN